MTPEQELDLLMADPSTDDVIRLSVTYPENPVTYVYVGVCFESRWYLSGVDGISSKPWPQLVAWLKRKEAEVTSLQTATSWEDTQ